MNTLTTFDESNNEMTLAIKSGLEVMSQLGGEFNEGEMKEIGAVLYGLCHTEGFIVPFDKVVTWLHYARKDHAKRVLVKNFKSDVDYKIHLPNKEDQKSGSGGHNKETIYMTMDAFEEFCMIAATSRGKLVRRFYKAILRKVSDFRRAIEERRISVFALDSSQETLDNITLANTRIGLAHAHPVLKQITQKIDDKNGWLLSQIYDIVNRCVSGVSKRQLGDMIGKDSSEFAHRDHMSEDQIKQLDVLINAIVRDASSYTSEYTAGSKVFRAFVKLKCEQVEAFCKQSLHGTLPARSNVCEPTITLEDARKMKRQKLELTK